MAFNNECEFLDRTKMESDRIIRGSKGGIYKPGVLRKKHPCLATEKWIYDCPEGCPYFRKK